MSLEAVEPIWNLLPLSRKKPRVIWTSAVVEKMTRRGLDARGRLGKAKSRRCRMVG